VTVKKKKKTVKHRYLISSDPKKSEAAIKEIFRENRIGFLALGPE
jgi:hypothetical protein